MKKTNTKRAPRKSGAPAAPAAVSPLVEIELRLHPTRSEFWRGVDCIASVANAHDPESLAAETEKMHAEIVAAGYKVTRKKFGDNGREIV